jgi:hypothetical protein
MAVLSCRAALLSDHNTKPDARNQNEHSWSSLYPYFHVATQPCKPFSTLPN